MLARQEVSASIQWPSGSGDWLDGIPRRRLSLTSWNLVSKSHSDPTGMVSCWSSKGDSAVMSPFRTAKANKHKQRKPVEFPESSASAQEQFGQRVTWISSVGNLERTPVSVRSHDGSLRIHVLQLCGKPVVVDAQAHRRLCKGRQLNRLALSNVCCVHGPLRPGLEATPGQHLPTEVEALN
jgi:hypothetical protein